MTMFVQVDVLGTKQAFEKMISELDTPLVSLDVVRCAVGPITEEVCILCLAVLAYTDWTAFQPFRGSAAIKPIHVVHRRMGCPSFCQGGGPQC